MPRSKGRKPKEQISQSQPLSKPQTDRRATVRRGFVGELLAHWWGKLATFVASVLTLTVINWAIYQIADGVREIYAATFPEIHVAGSDPGAPFSLPFSVTNQSNWFDMKNVTWECRVLLLETTVGTMHGDGGGLHLINNNGEYTITPKETHNFKCSTVVGGTILKNAKVVAEIHYKTLFLNRPPATKQFTWVANRWIEGEIDEEFETVPLPTFRVR